MRCLFIGLGSIALKHIEALKKNNIQEIFALRSSKKSFEYDDVMSLYEWDQIPSNIDFVVISNPTSEHLKSILKAAELKVPLFIEKPPLMSLAGSDNLLKVIKDNAIQTYTAFNLRFHPIIKWLKANLNLETVLEVQAYCGSYLPDWRASDYRDNYSSKRELGGGVHLDLIHEMDYVTWILGQPNEINAHFRKVSKLEIDSIDSATYYLEYEKYYAQIFLNYFRRDAKRTLDIVMEEDTWFANLIEGTISNINGETIFKTEENIQYTYDKQMEYFLQNFKNGNTFMNALPDSLQTLKNALVY